MEIEKLGHHNTISLFSVSGLEILNEVVPAGMDPLGIFLILKEEHKSVLDKIHLLLAALPVTIIA